MIYTHTDRQTHTNRWFRPSCRSHSKRDARPERQRRLQCCRGAGRSERSYTHTHTCAYQRLYACERVCVRVCLCVVCIHPDITRVHVAEKIATHVYTHTHFSGHWWVCVCVRVCVHATQCCLSAGLLWKKLYKYTHVCTRLHVKMHEGWGNTDTCKCACVHVCIHTRSGTHAGTQTLRRHICMYVCTCCVCSWESERAREREWKGERERESERKERERGRKSTRKKDKGREREREREREKERERAKDPYLLSCSR